MSFAARKPCTRGTREAADRRKLWAKLKERMDVVIEPFSPATTDGTDIHTALLGVLEKQPNLKSVVLISDGDWNSASRLSKLPRDWHARCRCLRCRWIGTTRPPDVELSSFDAHLRRGRQAAAHSVRHRQLLLPRDEVVVLEMKSTSGERSHEGHAARDEPLSDAIAWKPEKPAK
ncbi:MAG: hypothetical protein IPK22_26150 [Verrucomicrobiaceae bacterium]|nr:hypothetical protein [Verrucomicrobiaceae bacterium]